MSDDTPSSGGPSPAGRRKAPSPADPKAEREARLAEALRANLRRRKDRARAAKRAGEGDADPASDD